MVGMVVGDKEEHRYLGVGMRGQDLLKFLVGVFVIIEDHDGGWGRDGKAAMVEIGYSDHVLLRFYWFLQL